jgi:hypothetical protein
MILPIPSPGDYRYEPLHPALQHFYLTLILQLSGLAELADVTLEGAPKFK